MRKRNQKVLVIGTILVLVAMVFATLPMNAGAGGEILPPTVTKTASPEDIYFGTDDKETTVTIEVTGAGGTSTTITPMDVVFAIDSSGSMGSTDPSGLRKTAAKTFVTKMDDTRDQAGVVSWDMVYPPTWPTGIDFTFGLSDDFDVTDGVKYWIDQVDAYGGTDLNLGLNTAIAMLDANTRTEPSTEVIIFLTDGSGTYTWSGDPGSPADDADSKGYVIYSIGLTIPSGSIAEDRLIDMADATGGEYYSSPSAENLQAIFDAIYDEVVISTIPHYVDVIEVTESYIIGHDNFNIAPDSITINIDGTTTIIWDNIGQYTSDGTPDLDADETVTLSFTVRSNICGTNLDVDVDGEAKVEYYDKDEIYIGSVPIPQATINVHPFVTDLIAGGGNPKSAIDVGEVIAWNDEDYLYIKYETTGDWYMTETHLHVAADSIEGIPQKNGNPIPGKFDYNDEHDPAVQEYEYKIPWTWDAGTTLYIAAHAAVQKLIGYDEYCNPIYQKETAWGDGDDFPGKNWATYFEYEDP
ncbi:vWA domain-containing protein [[Eubacterium] cellulosolvens]